MAGAVAHHGLHMNEKEQSRQFNAFLDAWTRDPGAAPDAPDGMGDLAAIASKLFAVRDQLPQPTPAFEQRVRRQMRQAQQSTRRPGILGSWPKPRLRWLAPIAALILVVVLVLPGPRSALSNWMGSIELGSVEVVVSPDPAVRPALTDQHQRFDSLAAAAESTGMALLAPAYLPPGYASVGFEAVSFQELPVWMQPLFVESRFELDSDADNYLLLRQYNASRSDQAQLGQVEFQSKDVNATRQLALHDGTPAVLLAIGQSDPPLQELIWQRDSATFELWSSALSPVEMQHVAESVKP